MYTTCVDLSSALNVCHIHFFIYRKFPAVANWNLLIPLLCNLSRSTSIHFAFLVSRNFFFDVINAVLQ